MSAQSRAPHLQSVIETLQCFVLSEEEIAEVKQQFDCEMDRHLPAFLKSMTVGALLPLIQSRVRKFYLMNGVPISDAEDRAATVALKVLEGLSKNGSWGNVGAWIARIRFTVLMDYWRAIGRERSRLGNRESTDVLADVPDASSDEASLRLLIEQVPDDLREVVEQLLEGRDWQEIAEHHQKTVAEVKKSLQSLQWPEGTAPLRKKRQRRSPEA